MADEEMLLRSEGKTDLMVQVWQPFTIQGKQYYLKSNIKDDSYELLITDTIHIWYENCDCKTLKKRSKRLNPSVEAPVSRLLEHLRNNVEDERRHCDYEIEGETTEDVVLCINSMLAQGVPFTWKFQCHAASPTMIASHLTVPLLTMISELQRRQQHLQKLLQKKDSEIEDYKLNGAKVSRKHLETVPFDQTVFQKEMIKSQGFEEEVKDHGKSAFSQEGQELYKQIMRKHSWLERKKEDGEDVSADEHTYTSSSIDGPLPSSVRGDHSPSPKSSPVKSMSPVKDTELMRRQALEKRLAKEESKLASQKKKTKKGLF